MDYICEEFVKLYLNKDKEILTEMSDDEKDFVLNFFKKVDLSKAEITEYFDTLDIDKIVLDNFDLLFKEFEKHSNIVTTYLNKIKEIVKNLKDDNSKESISKDVFEVRYFFFEHFLTLLQDRSIHFIRLSETLTKPYFQKLENRIDYISLFKKSYDAELNEIIKKTNSSTKNLITSADLNKKSKELFYEAEKNVSGLVSNMLTVLGIFVAIIVAVLAVYITVFLNKENNVFLFFSNTPQLNLLKYVLSIHLLGNFIFMFLFFIAKLTNRTLMSSCVSFFPLQEEASHNEKTETTKGIEESEESEESEENRYLINDTLEKQKPCNRCAYACSSYRIIVNRLFHVLLFNGAMLFFYDCLYVWWYVVHIYELDKISFNIIAKEPYLFLFILLLILNVIFIVVIKKFVIDKPATFKNNCPCECVEEKIKNG